MTLTRSAGILAFYGILAFLPKKNKKSNPIFLILSDFFRFLDFSRLLDLPIPQLYSACLVFTRRQRWNADIAMSPNL